jgi:hypothetical protein
MRILILTCIGVLIASISMINGVNNFILKLVIQRLKIIYQIILQEKIISREKRSLFDLTGKQTMEDKFFENALGALDRLDGGRRKAKFVNLAEANKADGKIPNWGSVFNEKINRNYLWAVEHIGNELKNKKDRISRVNYNLVLKRAEEVSKFRGEGLDIYASDEKSY